MSISLCLVYREGTNTMLQSLQTAGVPVLVFSAGLGDSVSAVLKYHNALLPNVHIISNYLRFNGLQVNGFQGDIIHSFNKNKHAVDKSDYFEVRETKLLGTFVSKFSCSSDNQEQVCCNSHLLNPFEVSSYLSIMIMWFLQLMSLHVLRSWHVGTMSC